MEGRGGVGIEKGGGEGGGITFEVSSELICHR